MRLNKSLNAQVAYHGAGVNRPNRIAIGSGSKNSGKVWKSSKPVNHVVEQAEFFFLWLMLEGWQVAEVPHTTLPLL